MLVGRYNVKYLALAREEMERPGRKGPRYALNLEASFSWSLGTGASSLFPLRHQIPDLCCGLLVSAIKMLVQGFTTSVKFI